MFLIIFSLLKKEFIIAVLKKEFIIAVSIEYLFEHFY